MAQVKRYYITYIQVESETHFTEYCCVDNEEICIHKPKKKKKRIENVTIINFIYFFLFRFTFIEPKSKIVLEQKRRRWGFFSLTMKTFFLTIHQLNICSCVRKLQLNIFIQAKHLIYWHLVIQNFIRVSYTCEIVKVNFILDLTHVFFQRFSCYPSIRALIVLCHIYFSFVFSLYFTISSFSASTNDQNTVYYMLNNTTQRAPETKKNKRWKM